MTWRSVVVYWVLALAAGFHVYGVWRERGPVAAVEERPVAPIINATASSIDAMTVVRGDLSVEIERDGERWVVVRPAGLEVSNDLLDALLDTLTTIPPVEILSDDEDGGTSIAQFGLDPPLAVLALRSSGASVATVELGKRNPTRTAVYARLVEEDRLYLLGLNAQYYVELAYEQFEKQSRGMPRR